MQTARTLWRHSDFLKLWTAYTASQFGEQITLFCIPVVAAIVLDATPAEMGWLNAAQTAPFLLFTLAAGALLDRVRRRPLMIGADAMRAGLLTVIPVAAAIGWLSIPLLCVVGFLSMTATVLFDIADQSYVPVLVGREHLVDANSKLEASRSAGLIGGPGLAGALANLITPAFAVGINVATYLFSAICIIRIVKLEPIAKAREQRWTIWSDISDGLRFVAQHPLIRPLALCSLIWNLSWFNLMTVLVLFATREIALSPGAFGIVLSAQGVGAFLGALSAPWLRRHLGIGRAILLGPSICALGTPCIASAAAGDFGLPMLIVGQFLFGLGPTIWVVNQLSLRQAITPLRLQGRVNATIRFITYGMRPIGAFLGGILGSGIGLRPTIIISAILFFACLVPLLLSAVPKLRELPSAGDGLPVARTAEKLNEATGGGG